MWSYLTGDYVDSAPAFADGVVYVGSDDNNLYALNATTGATVWTYGTGNSVESSPAVANGVVYVGSDDNSVYAFGSIAVPQPSPTVPELSYFAVLVLMGFVTTAICWVQKRKSEPS